MEVIFDPIKDMLFSATQLWVKTTECMEHSLSVSADVTLQAMITCRMTCLSPPYEWQNNVTFPVIPYATGSDCPDAPVMTLMERSLPYGIEPVASNAAESLCFQEDAK